MTHHGRLCCLFCGSECSLEVFHRRHSRNGKACILANPERRTLWRLASIRYTLGWAHWTPEKESRALAIIELEHSKVFARDSRLQASA